MITVSQTTVCCDGCGQIASMRLDWDKFKLPEGWQFRTRSFSVDDKPDQVQIVCSAECARKV